MSSTNPSLTSGEDAGDRLIHGLISERLSMVDEVARECGAGAALVTQPAMARWLGVRKGAEAPIVVSSGAATLVPENASPAAALSAVGLRPDSRVAVDAPQPSGVAPFVLVDAASAFERLRICKSEDEVALIARAAVVASAGQRALAGAVAAGASEGELWRAAAAAVAELGAVSADAVVDLMVGARTELIGEPPGSAVARPGDAVLFDLAPELGGYWADSCATYCCGSPGQALRERHAGVSRALERGLEALRPGVRACDVDAEVREALARDGLECPHHVGHGVGTAPQEPPWLIPSDRTLLAEGAVIAIEPGAYGHGFGVRLEHLVVIEPDGARLLTTHSTELA